MKWPIQRDCVANWKSWTNLYWKSNLHRSNKKESYSSHIAKYIHENLLDLKLDALHHSSYDSNNVLLDYHLFRSLDHFLYREWYTNYEVEVVVLLKINNNNRELGRRWEKENYWENLIQKELIMPTWIYNWSLNISQLNVSKKSGRTFFSKLIR